MTYTSDLFCVPDRTNITPNEGSFDLGLGDLLK